MEENEVVENTIVETEPIEDTDLYSEEEIENDSSTGAGIALIAVGIAAAFAVGVKMADPIKNGFAKIRSKFSKKSEDGVIDVEPIFVENDEDTKETKENTKAKATK